LQRERLREKGQFWTPDWVADAMVAYVAQGGARDIFDPAAGAGAFFAAARRMEKEIGRPFRLSGTEVDATALAEAEVHGLTPSDLADVQITDFVLCPPDGPFPAIVANPPYIRHHRLSADMKRRLATLGRRLTGVTLDGRAGYHVFFLLRALETLEPGGRLAFILPADTCEGVFAERLWAWIARQYRLDAVITFAPEATPFPNVDVNPLIVLVRHVPPVDDVYWVRCSARTDDLTSGVLSGWIVRHDGPLSVHRRSLREALRTGLSRPPEDAPRPLAVLGDLASAMRGIATGANDFFLLTVDEAGRLGIPDEFLFPAIARTRDVPGNEVTEEVIQHLQVKGRPTLLFCPDGRPLGAFPPSVQAYLRRGEAIGLSQRPLISTRRPWYRMEVRDVPPILFAYLGRRNARFIRNHASVLPLTGFLCVYPHRAEPDYIDRLWRVLADPATAANLPLVGKSYGSGSVKVEPRALERLPLPGSVLRDAGLQPPSRGSQLHFP
jgi:hypothetical protein